MVDGEDDERIAATPTGRPAAIAVKIPAFPMLWMRLVLRVPEIRPEPL
jgi:hypothetical protein